MSRGAASELTTQGHRNRGRVRPRSPGRRCAPLDDPFLQEAAEFGTSLAMSGALVIVGATPDTSAYSAPPLYASSQYAVVFDAPSGAVVEYLGNPCDLPYFGISVGISVAFGMVGYETGS
jgi:hypothetical protein